MGLADQGYRVTFYEDILLQWPKHSNIKNTISIGSRDGILHKLNFKTKQQALNHEVHNSNELWHRRLGHLGFSALATIGKITTGPPNLKFDHISIFKGCALRKNKKGNFPLRKHKFKIVLELTHTNLCGSMSTPSLGGLLYYVTFIDDYSRKTWIYFLKLKESNEFLQKFKDFKALVENQTRKKKKH